MAKDFAESPSVKIRVQSFDFADPAKLASSNLGIPVSFLFFFPLVFSIACFCLNLAKDKIFSTTPDFSTCLMNLSDNLHVEPKEFFLEVRFYREGFNA